MPTGRNRGRHHDFLMANDDDDDLNKSLRDEELQVLESIYPEYISSAANDTIRLEIPVEFGTPRTVKCIDQSSVTVNPSLELLHLPPILLSIKLPPRYPSEESPAISSIFVAHSWLHNMLQLADILQRMWTVGEGILCRWVEFIQSGEALDALGLVNTQGVIQYVWHLYSHYKFK